MWLTPNLYLIIMGSTMLVTGIVSTILSFITVKEKVKRGEKKGDNSDAE